MKPRRIDAAATLLRLPNYPRHVIQARAFAKINLALAVGPPEPPRGYHPIASWFACIDLFDDLAVRRLPDGAVSRYDIRWVPDAPRPSPIDWPVEKDLAVRAHRALEARAGRPLAVEMTLSKRIPVGGGLGGGSSDAAAMLRAVDALFGLRLGAPALRDIAMTLGSDVAFFIDEQRGLDQPARPAIVTGLGERIERVACPEQGMALLLPLFGCPTGGVYRAFDLQEGGPGPLREGKVREVAARAERDGNVPSAELFNDLERPACIAEPRLGEALTALRTAVGSDAVVHVTGSGSTMFAMGRSGELSAAMAQRLAAAGREIAVVQTKVRA